MGVYELPGAKGWESQGYLGRPKKLLRTKEKTALSFCWYNVQCALWAKQHAWSSYCIWCTDSDPLGEWVCVQKTVKCFPEPFIVKDRYNICASRAAWEQPWSRETRNSKAWSTDLVCLCWGVKTDGGGRQVSREKTLTKGEFRGRT